MESPEQILGRHHLKPKKSWGQNFLADPGLLRDIARAAELGPGDAVVELGAGLGHLTRALAETGAQVWAVERDRELVHVLEAELKLPGVKVVAANAADVDFAALAGRSRVVVVGNLPYQLSSPILFQLLDQRRSVSRAVFTLQLEVAERLAASPGGRDYGLLSVLLQAFADVHLVRRISAGAFHPPPRVDSAVVRIDFREQPKVVVSDEARFRKLVKAAFAQRRKTLLNSLKGAAPAIPPSSLVQALEKAGVDPQRRAETLSPAEFAAIERAL